MTSIVIAAHNEESVLGKCLKALLSPGGVATRDVTVVANGCSDGTAEIASAFGVRVIDLEDAGKARALNAGDQAAVGYPRIYLDADIVVPPGTIDALEHALTIPGVLAAVPSRRPDVSHRPLLVRAYFAVSAELPAFRNSLFGRGVVAISAEGRARFDSFPDIVADDLFLDSLFSPDEKVQVDSMEILVATPRRTVDLVKRLVRVRRGNAALRAAGRDGNVVGAVRSADRWSWLTDVVWKHPRLFPAGVIYAAITIIASILARSEPVGSMSWGRDESTR